MNIGGAVEALQSGKRVARVGWDGKGMFLFLVMRENDENGCRGIVLGSEDEDLWEAEQHPFVVLRTANAQIVPWLCSQSDLLAEDWEVVGANGQGWV